MPDPLHQHALGGSGEFGETRVTRFALRAAELHLDEFVIVQRALGFGDDRGRDSVLADEEHGIERVAQTPQILALTFCSSMAAL